ncbi:unnamed protein product, partial [Cuscuta epithymum]
MECIFHDKVVSSHINIFSTSYRFVNFSILITASMLFNQ